MRPRILVGRLWHETNSFSPVLSTRFAVARGGDLLAQAGQATSLGGILRRLGQDGAIPIPSVAAWAPPGGLIPHALWEGFSEEFLDAARREAPDAIVLELHGALSTTKLGDADGELLSRLRQLVGPEVPITVALDLHGGISPRTMAAVDALSGYRTNPHADMVEAGERAAAWALWMLATGRRPARALGHVKLVLTGRTETTEEPLAGVHAAARRIAGAADYAVFNAYPLRDTPELGQQVTLVGDLPEAVLATRTAEIAAALWDRRAEFVADEPSPEAILADIHAGRLPRPVVIGDHGDRVLGGAPGDSTVLLHAIAASGLRACVPLYDPEAVAAAQEGARFRRAVGGRFTTAAPPFALDGEVLSLGPCVIRARGPYMAGIELDLGRVAVVRQGSLTVALTEAAPNAFDPAAFVAFGTRIETLDVAVAKSGNHFKLNFSGVAACVVARTDGWSANGDPAARRWTKATPFYPMSEPADPITIRAWAGR